jgi:hypothetical protein
MEQFKYNRIRHFMYEDKKEQTPDLLMQVVQETEQTDSFSNLRPGVRTFVVESPTKEEVERVARIEEIKRKILEEERKRQLTRSYALYPPVYFSQSSSYVPIVYNTMTLQMERKMIERKPEPEKICPICHDPTCRYWEAFKNA